MKDLNTLEKFRDGKFEIERNGEIISLNKDEIARFRFLDTALYGKKILESYITNNEEEKEIIKRLAMDEKECYDIQDILLDVALKDAGMIAHEILRRIINIQ